MIISKNRYKMASNLRNKVFTNSCSKKYRNTDWLPRAEMKTIYLEFTVTGVVFQHKFL
jgi:hypothetical protein